jgi:hypothetical protein
MASKGRKAGSNTCIVKMGTMWASKSDMIAASLVNLSLEETRVPMDLNNSFFRRDDVEKFVNGLEVPEGVLR